MMEAAKEHFTKGKHEMDKEMSEIQDEKKEVLKKRWELREKLQGCGNEGLEHLQMRLALLGFRLKKLKQKRQWRKWEVWEEKLSDAWRRGNNYLCWRIAGRVAKQMGGSKFRMYTITSSSSREEWKSLLGSEGTKGGLEAVEVNWEEEQKIS